MRARNLVLAQDALDDHFLGEVLVVILRAVNVPAKIGGQAEQLRLGFHELFIRAAGQVNGQAALLEPLQQGARAEDGQIVRAQFAVPQSVGAVADALIEPAKVFVFVPQRLARGAAAFGDAFGQLHHLVDRLLAIQAHDVVEADLAAGGLRLARQAGQHLDEHRHHDVRPALANNRQRAVKIKQDVADVRPGGEGGGEFHPPAESMGRHIIAPGRRFP